MKPLAGKRTSTRGARWIGSAAAALLCLAPPALAVHLGGLEVNILRATMNREGYLEYVHPGGEERTGWTDIRHPANDGTNHLITDRMLGYDRSDFHVDVHNKTVTIDAAGGGAVTASPNVPRDYSYANQIWVQAGLSVFSTGQQAVDFSTGNAAGNPVITAPVSPGDRTVIQAANRQANPTVNNWYASTGVTGGGGALRGVTRSPSPPGNATTYGTMIFDSAAHDTFAHELGHFLLDLHEFAGGSGHSPQANDLMASGALPRNLPGNTAKDAAMGAADTAAGGAPKDSGLAVGNLGTVDHLNAVVRLNNAGPALSQVQGVHTSAFIQRTDNGATHADRADFDWVEDNRNLETAGGGADNHAGADWMVWRIGAPAPGAHAGHDHDAWGSLAAPAFNGPYFNFVDVFSQVARYADSDVDGGGEWSRRNSALDYQIPEFSRNGATWLAGSLVNVFRPGWTNRSQADDWVARWASPIDATMVRIRSAMSAEHDENAQIDAVIAAPFTFTWIPKRFELTPTEVPIGEPLEIEVFPNEDPVPAELVQLTLAGAMGQEGSTPVPLNAELNGSDSGGVTGQGDEVQIEIVALSLSSANPLPQQDVFGFQVQNTASDGVTPGVLLDHGNGPFQTDWTDSIFDITYDVRLPELPLQRFLLHGEIAPQWAGQLFFNNVLVQPSGGGGSVGGTGLGAQSLDSFFDVFVGLNAVPGAVNDPGALFQLTLTGATLHVPEPGTMGLFALATVLACGFLPRRYGRGRT